MEFKENNFYDLHVNFIQILKKVDLAKENSQFLKVLNQRALQYIKKSFEDINFDIEIY